MVNTTEQIYKLVKQWCQALDSSKESEALHQIALISNCDCIPQVRGQFTEQDNQCVVQWLQENHPNAYLWAKSQQWIGHPAMVWGNESSPKTAINAKR
ncbi:MAG: hypothetical protein WBG73_01710 [Coleofasciculaceae cyanobacterium]